MNERQPVTCDLTLAYVSSLAVAVAVVLISVAGWLSGLSGQYHAASLVLVSPGADAANLAIVTPTLLAAMWLARRGSLIALLLWPGALFYVVYAYVPYLVGAEFNGLFFVYAALVTVSAFTVIGLVAAIDGVELRRRWASVPIRPVGVALVAIAFAAYAGLAGAAIAALADPAREVGQRPLAVADWAVGTPVLLLGGVLMCLRVPLGYVTGPGVLLVSGLGGVVFAAAALVDNVIGGPSTEGAVIAVHLVIAAVSFGLLAFFLLRARRASDGAGGA